MSKFKCPACQTELIRGNDKRYESLVEHVCNPNSVPTMKRTYFCPNKDCRCYDTFDWSEDGGRYRMRKDAPWNTKGWFIDDNDAPFGSQEREINEEMRKHG